MRRSRRKDTVERSRDQPNFQKTLKAPKPIVLRPPHANGPRDGRKTVNGLG
jgi:hypothetical protein